MTNLPVLLSGGIGRKTPMNGPQAKYVEATKWTTDGDPLPDDVFLVTDMFQVSTCFGEGEILDQVMPTPGEPLPDEDALNKAIPESDWPAGFDGKPRPPWVRQYVVHLLRLHDAAAFTFVNGTNGSRVAFDRLESKIKSMQLLRGRRVVPLVRLGEAKMKTSFGPKMRPHFDVIEWRVIEDGGESPVLIEAPKSSKLPGTALKDTPAGEFLNDALPSSL
jgi:hypothetical protein